MNKKTPHTVTFGCLFVLITMYMTEQYQHEVSKPVITRGKKYLKEKKYYEEGRNIIKGKESLYNISSEGKDIIQKNFPGRNFFGGRNNM